MHLSLQWGQTALMIAYDHGQIECAEMLMDMGAQVNIQDTVSLSGVITHCVQCNAACMPSPQLWMMTIVCRNPS